MNENHWRIALGVVGVLLTVLGVAIDVMAEDTTVELAAVGGGILLMYLAASGLRLSAFKGPGGIEAAFVDAIEQKVELASKLERVFKDPRAEGEVAGDVADNVQLPEKVRAAADRRRKAIAYEEKVFRRLEEVALNNGWSLSASRDVDARLADRSGQVVLVEIIFTQEEPSRRRFEDWCDDLAKASQLASQLADVKGAVLVARLLPQDVPDWPPDLAWTAWDEGKRPDLLEKALHHAFARQEV